MVVDPQLLQGKPREEIVKHYFLAGLSYQEILEFLKSYHGVHITLRQLNRILRKDSLFRRHKKTPLNVVIEKIKKLLNSSDRSFGYRSMHLKLRNMGITLDRETVRLTIKALDPEGVQNRLSNRLHTQVT